jgi:hypothetical protein
MRCKKPIRRFKTETVEYLKTRKKLLTVEQGKLSSDSEVASYPIRRMARGNSGLRSGLPVTITVAWHDLETTVTNERKAQPSPTPTVPRLRSRDAARESGLLFGEATDEDRKTTRVGRLERVKPIFLLSETLKHRQSRRFGAATVQVHERKRGNGRAEAGGVKTLEG